MLFSFDLDCGELIKGHRFVARGLADRGVQEHDGDPVRKVSLEYELVPGVPQMERPDVWLYLVSIDYSTDVPLPWHPGDNGSIQPFAGGASTHGSRGRWPLPASASRVMLHLWRPDERRRDLSLKPGREAGVIQIDLVARQAVWTPVKARFARRRRSHRRGLLDDRRRLRGWGGG